MRSKGGTSTSVDASTAGLQFARVLTSETTEAEELATANLRVAIWLEAVVRLDGGVVVTLDAKATAIWGPTATFAAIRKIAPPKFRSIFARETRIATPTAQADTGITEAVE